MAYWRRTKTEHSGPKNRGRKNGFYGLRRTAKQYSKKIRRKNDRVELEIESSSDGFQDEGK